MSVEAKADIPMVVLRDNGPKERNASINSGTTAGNDDDDDADPVVDRNLVGCFGLKCHAIDQELNSIHITWDGDDDPGNPRNWPRSIRLRLSGILSILVALPIVHTTMLAPAGLAIRDALHLKDTESMQWVVSFANLAGGIGPLFIAPQSEVYGRRYMVHGCTFLFLAFNTGSGFAQTQWQLGTCRSLAAFFGCALKPIASGVLADCFKKTEMGIATAMFAAVPLILPSLGPVGGGYVVEHAGWKWICYGLSILGIIAQVVAYWFVPETFPPIILHKKLKQEEKRTGNHHLYIARHTDDDWPRFRATLRPFNMYFEPVIWLLGLYQALIVGIYFLMMYTFTRLWRKDYGQSVSVSGLHYLANTIGFAVGASASVFNDRVYKYMTRKYGGIGKPEYRMPVMIFGAFLVPAGLFWYGWTAHRKYFWLAVDFGFGVYSCGYVVGTISFHTYIIDFYGTYAASATASVTLATGIVGCVLPIYGGKIFDKLGQGMGHTVLGSVSAGVGILTPIILWWNGDRLRRSSSYVNQQEAPVSV